MRLYQILREQQVTELLQAYLGKLMAELQVKSREDLKNCEQPFDKCDSYQKIVCFADTDLKKILAGYIDYIVARNENAYLDETYSRAQKIMMETNTLMGYKKAAQLFASIEDYKDSAELVLKCHDRAKKKEKQLKKIAFIVSPIICIAVAFAIILNAVIIPNINYKNAVGYMDAGDVIAAYEALVGMNGYKDSAELAESIYEEYEIEKATQAKVGDYILFGAYEQDNDSSNGQEKIEWKVLEKRGNRILVISKYVLDGKKFESRSDVFQPVWKDSTLRSWLNTDFLNCAFTDKEQSRIPTVKSYVDPTMQWYQVKNATEDKIFLLASVEVWQYFDLGDKYCSPTEYANANGAGKVDNGSCDWWLRSPGDDAYHIDVVDTRGEVYGLENFGSSNGVRPAMWISLE